MLPVRYIPACTLYPRTRRMLCRCTQVLYDLIIRCLHRTRCMLAF
ncbi:unnamed protein product, partial [Laminaria digitata]